MTEHTLMGWTARQVGELIEASIRKTDHEIRRQAEIKETLDYYLVSGTPPGHFLEAVLSDELHEAVVFADAVSQWCLVWTVQHIVSSFPLNAWGSRDTINKWMAMRDEERSEILAVRDRFVDDRAVEAQAAKRVGVVGADTKQIACPWCDIMQDSDPGYGYHTARCQERVLTKAIKLANEFRADLTLAEFVTHLEARIEQVRYVGD